MIARTSAVNLAAPLCAYARAVPGRVALVVDEIDYSYGELAAAAARVAVWVRNGRARDDNSAPPCVGVLASRSAEAYGAILGAAWAGGTYIPLSPKMPAARLASILAQAKLDALIVDRKGRPRLKELGAALPPRVLTPDEHLENDATFEPVEVGPDHPAYMIFTSGTTGTPKGVVVTAGGVQHLLSCIHELYEITPEDRVAQFFETTFDVSVCEMFGCWDGGAALHVVPEMKLMAPAGFIRQEWITVLHAVPSLISMMARLGQLTDGSLPSLRVSIFGGEGVPVAALRTWQAAAPNSIIENQYGPTECTVACFAQRLTDPPIETPGRGTLAIGVPFRGTHAAIVDAHQQFLGAEQIGELALCGPQLATGYLNDEEKTADRFRMLIHPELGATRWYLTGDSAFFDAEGRFHCLGRLDHQVKVMGHRVELEEIEAHLRAICSSESVAAIPWPENNGSAAGIVAFVVGARIAPPVVREQLRDRMPMYMVPSKVMALESMPLLASGKVDRKALRDLLSGTREQVGV